MTINIAKCAGEDINGHRILHYIATGHFIIRRMERKFSEDVVRKNYEKVEI